MTDGNEAAARVVDAFNKLGIEYLPAGSYSSNFYGIPRSTRDADFVAFFSSDISSLARELGEEFELEPQSSFESVTGTLREIIQIPSIKFKIAIFHLSSDPHDRTRFERKQEVFDVILGRNVFIPSAEDVIVMKLRWATIAQRNKDADDISNVIAVLGDDALDWNYIHRWAAEHGTPDKLDEIRASIPPLD